MLACIASGPLYLVGHDRVSIFLAPTATKDAHGWSNDIAFIVLSLHG
jgi:hypothetical protein